MKLKGLDHVGFVGWTLGAILNIFEGKAWSRGKFSERTQVGKIYGVRRNCLVKLP